MYIKSENPAHKWSGVGKKPGLKTPKMDERIEFSKNGKARVSKDVGTYLAGEFDSIHIVKEEGKDNGE